MDEICPATKRLYRNGSIPSNYAAKFGLPQQIMANPGNADPIGPLVAQRAGSAANREPARRRVDVLAGAGDLERAFVLLSQRGVIDDRTIQRPLPATSNAW